MILLKWKKLVDDVLYFCKSLFCLAEQRQLDSRNLLLHSSVVLVEAYEEILASRICSWKREECFNSLVDILL